MKQPTTGVLPCNNEDLTNKNDKIRGWIYIYIHSVSDLLILAMGYQWENNCESILFDQIFKRIWVQTIGIYSTQMVVEWYASWGYYAAYGHILSYIGKVEEYEYDMPRPILKNYRFSTVSSAMSISVNPSRQWRLPHGSWQDSHPTSLAGRFRQCVFHPNS